MLPRHRGMPRRGRGRRRRDLLDRVGIPDPQRRLEEYPHQLSGGMRQRALIAMALACQPRLLIADEPTTALDVTIQAQILELLKELVARHGTALVMITHDLGVVAGLCDTVNVHVRRPDRGDGRPARRCSPQPRHPYTGGLLGSMPAAGRRRAASRCTRSPARSATPSRGPDGCAFAPRCARRTTTAWASRRSCAARRPQTGATRTAAPCADPRRTTATARGASAGAGSRGRRRDRPAPADVRRDRGAARRGRATSRCTSRSSAGVLFDRTVGHVKAVDGVDLDIPRGQTYGLVGESGCGKSTLGRALLRLVEPTARRGHLRRRRRAGAQAARRCAGMRRRMQMIFQDPLSSLDPRQNVESILTEPLQAARRRRRRRATRAADRGELLGRVGLPASALSRYPHEFSGGQRQRIGIARAIALEPGADRRRRAGLARWTSRSRPRCSTCSRSCRSSSA